MGSYMVNHCKALGGITILAIISVALVKLDADLATKVLLAVGIIFFYGFTRNVIALLTQILLFTRMNFITTEYGRVRPGDETLSKDALEEDLKIVQENNELEGRPGFLVWAAASVVFAVILFVVFGFWEEFEKYAL